MNSNNQKIILNLDDDKYLDWKICLKNKLKKINSNNIEIDSKGLDLSCTDITEIIALSKEFNCKILGSINDKNNIPGIDITLKNKELYQNEDFEFTTYFTPGHTLGHVVFYFNKQNFLFTGDTLFSLGCGRIFEGTYEQMFNSLNIIKKFSDETLVYFGHEYTLQNSEFCIHHDPENKSLKNKIISISEKLKNNLSTTPTNLKDELECNIFLRCKNLDSFSKLRDLKDNF